MERDLANRNKRYRIPDELEKANSFTDIKGVNTFAAVKTSTSPNFKWIVLIVVVGVVAVGGIAALIVVLTTKSDDGEKTTVKPEETQQTTLPVTLETSNPTTSTTPEPGVGSWSPWGDWTQCTATCNSGIHKRYRTCNGEDSTECLGDFVETEVCFMTECPVYGKWTTWGSWGNCDVTCGGGTQSRSRTCTKTDSSYLECVGSSSQDKTCSDWECPDCSKSCTEGTLNIDCDTCVCDGTIITGRVLAISTGYPISNAALYASTAPTKLLTQSNSTGFFTLDATCTMTEIIATRDGFVDEFVLVSSEYLVINMTKLVLPYLTETPQTKYRLSGEGVTLCCEAVASPSIEYYEWFKDNLLLDETLYQEGNKLILSDLTTKESGRYQCRANSEAGAIMSPAATLSIKDTANDFCSAALQQKTLALPDDCVQSKTNTATYEVGECISKRCRENTTTGAGVCREDISSCCRTGEANLETVQCSGYELELVVVRSCTCAACTSNSLTISGKAIGLGDGSPLKFGEVWVNGDFMTYTSIEGEFSFVASKTSSKVIIHLKDSYFRQFLPAIKTVEITDEMSGVLSVDIMMFQSVDPVEIDSATENTLVAGSSTGNQTTPIIQISIPANSFYYPDGTQYNGTVEASLTFLDPTNTSVLSNIPGIFQIVDEEGETANLASLGVFNLYFETSTGQPLILDEVVDLYLPLDVGGGATDEDIKLWRMNTETGIWEYVTPGTGTRRRKRQDTALLVGEIDWSTVNERDWFNYDYVYRLTDNPCFFKIRFFKDHALEEPVPNPQRYIKVDYHILKYETTLITVNDYISYPETDCINAICEDDNAYISAYYYGRNGYDYLYAASPEIVSSSHYYEIMDNNKVLKIQMSATNNGPFYSDEVQCMASTSNDSHLRYHYQKTPEIFTFQTTLALGPGLTLKKVKEISQKTWYPDRDEGYRVCFIKVRILFEGVLNLSPGQTIKVRATSYGGTFTEIKDFIFGIREEEISNAEDTTICIEYKCSGEIDPLFTKQTDFTKVVLTLIYPNSDFECRITDEADFVSSAPTLSNVPQIGSTSGNYTLFAPTVYSPDLGLYSATSDSLDYLSAAEIANGECRSGIPQKTDEDNPDIGVAVTFTFKEICFWWYSWFYEDHVCY